MLLSGGPCLMCVAVCACRRVLLCMLHASLVRPSTIQPVLEGVAGVLLCPSSTSMHPRYQSVSPVGVCCICSCCLPLVCTAACCAVPSLMMLWWTDRQLSAGEGFRSPAEQTSCGSYQQYDTPAACKVSVCCAAWQQCVVSK
jgi:hypothetical protein